MNAYVILDSEENYVEERKFYILLWNLTNPVLPVV